MSDLNLLPAEQKSDPITDWMIRGGVALVFFLFGIGKFTSESHWRIMFQEIGFGMWFQYFTGAVELLGSLLVLIPRAAFWGLALLSCTMASATLIVAFILKKPGESIFPALFFIAVTAIAVWRWNHDASAS